jgi:hypothetical protein
MVQEVVVDHGPGPHVLKENCQATLDNAPLVHKLLGMI